MKKIAFIVCCLLAANNVFSQWGTLFLRDPDKNAPTNVRSSPGGAIITTIDGRSADYEMEIISKEGNYFLVKSYISCEMEEPIVLNEPGYIHYSVLGAVISNYAKKSFPVYASSSKGTPLKMVNLSEEFVNVLDKVNNMYYVYSKKLNLKFWVDDKYICNAACTTCS
jgi:hypothetical protein